MVSSDVIFTESHQKPLPNVSKLGVSIGRHPNLPIATYQIKVKLIYSLSFLDNFVPTQFLILPYFLLSEPVSRVYIGSCYLMGEMAFCVVQIAIFVR